MLDQNSQLPIYIQLANLIKSKVDKMETGEQLPSEHELKDTYGVSRASVRHAIDMLVRENVLYRVRGVGTFVKSQTISPNVNEFFSFSEFSKSIKKPQKTRILSFSIEKASKKVLEKLELKENEKVYKIIRLRSTEESPIIYQTVYIPEQIAPNLTLEKVEKNGLYVTLINDYSLSIDTFDDIFKVGTANEIESNMLEMEADSPVMTISRRTKSLDKIVEYTVSVINSNYFEFKVRLDARGVAIV